jgi:hypothetical protein
MLEAKEHPTKRGRGKAVTADDAERMRTLLDGGMSKYRIARSFHGKYSVSTVYRELAK